MDSGNSSWFQIARRGTGTIPAQHRASLDHSETTRFGGGTTCLSKSRRSRLYRSLALALQTLGRVSSGFATGPTLPSGVIDSGGRDAGAGGWPLPEHTQPPQPSRLGTNLWETACFKAPRKSNSRRPFLCARPETHRRWQPRSHAQLPARSRKRIPFTELKARFELPEFVRHDLKTSQQIKVCNLEGD
jgi:hypothetical protein